MQRKVAFCENYMTYADTVCEQNAELIKVSASGTVCITTTVL
jgi:hypothetical protein